MKFSLLCNLLRTHRWNWEYESPKSCAQANTCARCGQKQGGKINHQFGTWEYKSQESCEQIRVCARCGDFEETLAHRVESWRYKSQESCEQIRVCARCGQKQEEKINHQLGTWEYKSQESCEQIRVCARCNQSTETRVLHEWGAWQWEARRIHARTCIRDQAVERVPHDDSYDVIEETCGNCGGAGDFEGGYGNNTIVYTCDSCNGSGVVRYSVERCRACN